MRAFSGGLSVSIAVSACAFAACSIATSWDGLPIDVAPNADGCARRPGRSDACICVVGSPYCGNDQIVGDENSLYLCQPDYSGTLVKECDAGCVVNANANDACR